MMKWVLGVVAVEALTEILIHGRPFEWFRKFMGKWDFTKELIQCGWCLSAWIAFGVFGIIMAGWGIILIPFVIHRLSNVFHFGVMILREIRWRK
jgi:hypothetical protein